MSFIGMDLVKVIDLTPIQPRKMPYYIITCQDSFVFSYLNIFLKYSISSLLYVKILMELLIQIGLALLFFFYRLFITSNSLWRHAFTFLI